MSVERAWTALRRKIPCATRDPLRSEGVGRPQEVESSIDKETM